MMGPGMTGDGWSAAPPRHLSLDEVRRLLEHRVAWHQFSRLEVGEVTEKDADVIVAEIVTLDGSLVQRYEVNRDTGLFTAVE